MRYYIYQTLLYYKLYLHGNMQADPLLVARQKIAVSSLRKSHERIKIERKTVKQLDQTEIDSKFDELVYSSFQFDNIFTDYGDDSAVTNGRFSQGSQYFVTVGASGEGKIWNVFDENTPEFGKEVSGFKAVDKLCDVDIHPSIGKIPTFAPNIITGTAFGQIMVWTFDPTLKQQKSIKIKGHSDRINTIRFHQFAPVFLTASYDKTWSIWDSSRIKQLSNQKGHSKEIHTMSLHPDGSLILTGDLGGDGMVWDLRTGKGIYQFDSNNSIICSCFHPNGFEFAVGGKNNMIDIYDLRRKKQIKSIPAHLKLVSDLTYSQNGALLFSAGHDNVVKMWHGRNYSSVGGELEHAAKISSISYSSGKLGVTMLDRKWTIWSNTKHLRNLEASSLKIQAHNQAVGQSV